MSRRAAALVRWLVSATAAALLAGSAPPARGADDCPPFRELRPARIVRDRSVLWLTRSVDPTWFAVAPPLIAEESDLDEMCGLIEKSVADALQAVRP